jgi:hypothetical protein
VAFMALAVVSLFPLYQARSQATVENNQQQDELNNVSREFNFANLTAEENALTENAILEIIAGNEALQAANRDLLSTRGDITIDLQFVTGALPSSLDFTLIEINSRQVTVHGEADNVFAVIEYAIALEAEGLFPEVRITELDETESIIQQADDTVTEPVTVNKITFGIVMNK